MTENYSEAMRNLKRQQDNVVYPLVEQVEKREKVLVELKEREKQLSQKLKMVHAVIRAPKLCDMFHKAER